jgi:hypothetical protein
MRTDKSSLQRPDARQRDGERRVVTLPARMTWKDQRGATRFATVTIRNVSDRGVYVESESPLSIPLFRLVQFQLGATCVSDALPGRCSRAVLARSTASRRRRARSRRGSR